MWEIAIHPDALRTLKKLSRETSKSLFLFLNDYLPKDLTAAKLAAAKIKMLKGIYLFPKHTPKGMVHLFARIEFETHTIKVLHISITKIKSKRKPVARL
ncbi:MAG: hypothetical protein JSR17_00675 [Proteobacteria bacterium]|nr:hypothetical protein [Pseudomonadota bacterium]